MKRDYVTIGGFEMTCSTMRASDPSHDDTIWCYGTISDCMPGNWEAAVLYNGDSAYTVLQHKNEQGQVDCAVILFLPEEKKRRR